MDNEPQMTSPTPIPESPKAPEPTLTSDERLDKGLQLAAFIINIVWMTAIALVLSVVAVFIGPRAYLPLAWMLALTVLSWFVYRGRFDNSVALGVCMLIFQNVVSGILLLVSQKEDK